MQLEPGTSIGSYQIVAPLGAGGMGEVYRARDPKLEREVAIKVLPEGFADNEERLARFEREAKSLAALSHPNIATIFGFEELDGTHFLVMELVEGEDLAERISRGPIPVDEAIALFVQIAEGLEAAHERGIVHRDLKPANVMITRDGRAKLLDFGLAKAAAAPVPDPDLSQSPTRTEIATTGGQILGTAAYMSPEQARGETVDQRTDVWALGCCLFEALAGAPAFGGKTVSDTLASILRDAPDWQRLPPGVPAWIRRLLERLLAKSTRDRLRDFGDIRVLLAAGGEEVQEELPAPPQAAWRRWAVPLALGLLLGAIATFWGLRAASTAGADSEAERDLLVRRHSIGLEGLRPGFHGDDGVVTLSPDGSTLALTAGTGLGSRVYLRERSSFELSPLSGVEGAWFKSFSPDGEWLLYGTFGDERLRRVPRAGGTPLQVAQGDQIFGHDWDGLAHVVFAAPGGLRRVAIDGGETESLTEIAPGEGQLEHRFPQVLPEGRGVLFTMVSGSSPDQSSIAVVDARGEVRTLVRGGIFGRYVGSGHLVYSSGPDLFAVRMDLSRLEVAGMPARVVDGVYSRPSYGLAAYTVSASGDLAYVPDTTLEALHRHLLWIDRQGRSERVSVEAGSYASPRLSPDDGLIALTDSSEAQVVVFDVRTSQRNQITRQGSNFEAVWGPDGESLFFVSDRDGHWDLYRKNILGSGAAIRLNPEGTTVREPTPTSVTGEGMVSVRRDNPGRSYEMGILDPEDPSEWRLLVASEGNVTNGRFSPDDRWFAYELWRSGAPEVFVQPHPPTGMRWKVSEADGRSPVWSPAASELFYLEGPDRMMVASFRVEGNELRPEPARELFRHPIHDSGVGLGLFDVTSDGQRFLAVEAQDLSKGKIIVVENWQEELKRLVPAD